MLFEKFVETTNQIFDKNSAMLVQISNLISDLDVACSGFIAASKYSHNKPLVLENSNSCDKNEKAGSINAKD